MKLTEEEFDVLWQIEEGIDSFDSIRSCNHKNLSLDKIKEIAKKLEKQGLIKINKKFDPYYKKEWEEIIITDKENVYPLYKKYKEWIPKED